MQLKDEEYRSFLKGFGDRVKEIRKRKKIRLLDIMTSTGAYEAQWRRYEAGEGLTMQSLMKIALALDVSLTCLLDGLGEWPSLSVDQIEKQRRERKSDGTNDVPNIALPAGAPVASSNRTSASPRRRKSST